MGSLLFTQPDVIVCSVFGSMCSVSKPEKMFEKFKVDEKFLKRVSKMFYRLHQSENIYIIYRENTYTFATFRTPLYTGSSSFLREFFVASGRMGT